MKEDAAYFVSTVRTLARQGKGQKSRLTVAHAIEQLPYAEALEFVRLVKISQGAQDLALLPDDTTWHMSYVTPIGTDCVALVTAPTNLVRATAERYDFSISWPSVTSHWGILITFETKPGYRWTCKTPDYALTETYLSM